jgi:hypothetical protein
VGEEARPAAADRESQRAALRDWVPVWAGAGSREPVLAPVLEREPELAPAGVMPSVSSLVVEARVEAPWSGPVAVKEEGAEAPLVPRSGYPESLRSEALRSRAR